MPGALFIEGEKINLRTVEEEDLEFIRETFNIPEVRKHLSHRGPQNLNQERTFFEEVISGDEATNLAISRNEEMIGLISLTEQKEEGVKEIGLWIHPDHHGNGYGTEASKVMVSYAFNELRIHKIIAKAMESNPGSQRIWEKLGFQREGELRENTFRNGSYEDVYLYGVIEDEWLSS